MNQFQPWTMGYLISSFIAANSTFSSTPWHILVQVAQKQKEIVAHNLLHTDALRIGNLLLGISNSSVAGIASLAGFLVASGLLRAA